MKFLKLASANALILSILLLICEFSYRTFSGIKDKNFPETIFPIRKRHGIGFTKFDKDFGYLPAPGFNGILWDDAKVTILSDSTRKSSAEPKEIKKAITLKSNVIVTVGDSFAFGDEVADSDTWQYCLNIRHDSSFFINAGVGGYGILQPILRAEELIKKHSTGVSGVILSVLVGVDAARDRLDFRSGFPKPSLLKTSSGDIIPAGVPLDYKTAIGSRFTADQANIISAVITNITFLAKIPFVSEVYKEHASLYLNSLNRQNSSPPSVKEIYSWSAKKLKTLHPNTIVLLQYTSSINNSNSSHIEKERSTFKNILQQENIPFIDTYNSLHSDTSKHPKSQIWDNHYTPLGNNIVCQAVSNYFSRNP